jgi:hypothetical protein
MNTLVRKSLSVGGLSAGFLLIAGTAAHASPTTGHDHASAGNRANTVVTQGRAAAKAQGEHSLYSVYSAAHDTGRGGRSHTGDDSGRGHEFDSSYRRDGSHGAGRDGGGRHRADGAHGSGHVIVVGGVQRSSVHRTVVTAVASSILVEVPVNSCDGRSMAVGSYANIVDGHGASHRAPIRSCGNRLAVLDIGSADCDANDIVRFASGFRSHIVAFGGGHNARGGGHWDGWQRGHGHSDGRRDGHSDGHSDGRRDGRGDGHSDGRRDGHSDGRGHGRDSGSGRDSGRRNVGNGHGRGADDCSCDNGHDGRLVHLLTG